MSRLVTALDTPMCIGRVCNSVQFTICYFVTVSESLVFPKNSYRNQSYFKLQKDFQKRKSIIFFFFPPLAVLHVSHTFYPMTPIDTPRCLSTPQDALYMVRKSFILFYMINYQESYNFLSMYNSFAQKNIQILLALVHVTEIIDNFLKNCLERMEVSSRYTSF